MATLRGEGAFKNVPLIVHSSEKGKVYKKDEAGNRTSELKGRYIDIQVDQSLLPPDKVRTGEKAADSNPYLNSREETIPDTSAGDGATRKIVSHRQYYTEEQFQAMCEAAGKKHLTIDEPNNMGKGEILSIEANVFCNPTTKEVIVNTKDEMKMGRNPRFGKNTLEHQKAVTKAAKEFRAAQLAAEKNDPGIEVQAEAAAEATMDAPSM